MLEAAHHAQRRNGYGLAAIVISAASSLGLMLSIAAATVMVADGANQSDVRMGLLGLLMLACMLAELIALGLGIVGLRQKEKGKGAALSATILSSAMFILMIIILIIGALVA